MDSDEARLRDPFDAAWRRVVLESAPVVVRGWLLAAGVRVEGEQVLVEVPQSGLGLGLGLLQGLEGTLQEALLKTTGQLYRIEFAAGAEGEIAKPEAPAPAPLSAAQPRERLVFGRAFHGRTTPLREISIDASRVIAEGEVVSVDTRPRRGGGQIVTLGLSDHDDGLVVKFLVDERQRLLKEPSAGDWLRVRGQIGSDERQGEPILWARDAYLLHREQRRATLDCDRVELHLHTRMSQMDGLIDLARMAEAAERLRISAFAVTDHGVLQAFPEAQEIARKHGLKVIYGLEAFVVQDRPPITMRAGTQSVSGDFVALDIETTSLSPRSGEVIEVGLVRFAGGQKVDEYETLVRPQGEVSQRTQELTGIDPLSLKDAPSLDQVAGEILAFIGDLPVIAHNASFDEGYLRTAFSRLGHRVAWPVVDTLELGRALCPELRSHRLPDLAKRFEIGEFTHHRASSDAEVAGRVAVRLLEMAAKAGAKTLGELDGLGERIPLQHRRPQHVMLLVKSQTGLRELYRAVSRAHLEQFHRVPRLYESEVRALRGEVLVGAAGCLQGSLMRMWLRGAEESELVALAGALDYLEVLPPEVLLASARAEGYLTSLEQAKAAVQAVVELGRRTGRPVVAVGDAHYIDPDERELRAIVLRGTGRETPGDAEREVHLRTAGEMLQDFAWLGAEAAEEICLRNPERIRDLVGDVQPVPDELSAPELPEAAQAVEREARERARELYGEPLPELIAQRMERELKAVIGNGFSSIYRIAQLLTRRSLEDGYLVGSRGSVGSSFVAYLTGITEVNPLPPHWRCPTCKEVVFAPEAGSGFDLRRRTCERCGVEMARDGQDIPFETFMGFDGDKVPDIDLNFSGEYQPQIHRYTEELLGGQVYRAGTIATIAERTAFGLVKGHLEAAGRTARAPELERLARGVTGVKRTTGQHPGGVMVVPVTDDVHRFTPLQHPADDPHSEIVTTHFDYHAISSRLLKLDLLGHDDPTVLRLLERFTGIPAREVPCDDEEALSLFSSCQALGLTPEVLGTSVGSYGLPEFGTRFVRQMLEATKPSSFADLVRISGLSHGTDVWTHNADELIRQGTVTLREVIATREDILLNLIAWGLPPSHAFQITERVRKGKGLTPDQESEMRAHQVPDWYIGSCQKIGYMFPKAHAAAYVMMAVRIAYFKVHHPEAYYATYLSVRAGEFDTSLAGLDPEELQRRRQEIEQNRGATARERSVATILEVVREMRLRGIRFAPLDLTESDERLFLPIGQKLIRPPLVALAGLGPNGAHQLAEARSERPFTSLADLRERGRVPRPVLETLQSLGALGGLPATDQMTLF